MRTLYLISKILGNGVILVSGLLWSGTSIPFALTASLLLTFLSYTLGDRIILLRTTNAFASTAEFSLSFSLLWIACLLFSQRFSLSGLFFTSFALATVDYMYHSYLLRVRIQETRQPG